MEFTTTEWCENVNSEWFPEGTIKQSSVLRTCVLRRKGQYKPKVKIHMNGELVGEINEHTYPPPQDQI